MKINRDNVKELLSMLNVAPTKDLGQNFLVEPDVCEKIVSFCDINDNDRVLEIGPGLGSLTHFLCDKTNNLTCVEIDKNLVKILKDIYQEKNINFVNEDITKYNDFNCDKIIGNLPYNITTDLIINLLLNYSQCKKYILMIQAEAFNRFFDTKGKEYGPASILVHMIGDIKKLLVVKPGSFYPSPKCNSLVFSIDVKEEVDRKRAKDVYKLAKQLFLNRRKTIFNNLTSVCDKEKARNILSQLKIEENKRPEELIVQDFEHIFDLLNQ